MAFGLSRRTRADIVADPQTRKRQIVPRTSMSEPLILRLFSLKVGRCVREVRASSDAVAMLCNTLVRGVRLVCLPIYFIHEIMNLFYYRRLEKRVLRSDRSLIERENRCSWGTGSCYSHATSSARNRSHDKLKRNLVPAPNQSTTARPPRSRESQAALIPPTRIIATAASLLFRFGLCQFSKLVSPPKSLYTLVNTVVGTSLKPKDFAVTIWAPDWAARKGMAMKTSLLSAVDSGTASVWTRVAAMTMQKV